MSIATKRRIVALAALPTAFIAASQLQAAPWYVARYNGTGGNTDNGSNAIANGAPVASASSNLFDYSDDTNGHPALFGLNLAIPGNVAGNEDNYSVVGSGILNVTTTGSYIFRSSADDGAKITLNGRNIVSTGGSCCGNNNSAAINLTAGQKMTIQYHYNEGGGNSGGEISVSSDGGATFNLLGQGSIGSFNAAPGLVVDQSFTPAILSTGRGAGLRGEYWAVNHANSNAASDAFFAGNPAPTGTFISTSPNYSVAGTISAHLGADAASLTAGGANGTDNSSFRLKGFLQVLTTDDFDLTQPGIQVAFRDLSDDNSRLTIGGFVIAEYDGGHGFGDGSNDDTLPSSTNEHGPGSQIITFQNAGLYSIEAFYHNGGGGLGLNLQSSIGAGGPTFPLVTLPGSRLFQEVATPEPATFGLLALGGMALVRRRRRA